jgi:hypothetical protein
MSRKNASHRKVAVAMDQSKFGEVVGQLMDIIDSAYDENAELASVMILAAVKQDGTTTVHYPASAGTPLHEALGLLEYARHNLLTQGWGTPTE